MQALDPRGIVYYKPRDTGWTYIAKHLYLAVDQVDILIQQFSKINILLTIESIAK